MPTYCYRDPNGKPVELVMTIKEMLRRSRKDLSIIEKGVRLERDMAMETAGGHLSSCWPMTSESLAVHPSQVKDYTKDARDRGVATEFKQTGEPIFRDRNHRKNYLKAYGYHDRAGGYSD